MKTKFLYRIFLLLGTVFAQYEIKPINNTLGIYYHDEARIVVSNYKWTLLVHRNITTLQIIFDNNNRILETLKQTINPERDSVHHVINSFRADVKTHISLLTQTTDSIRNKLSEIILDTRRQKRGILNGAGTLFKAITGNLDAADGEYFTESINKLNQGQLQLENLLKNQMSITSTVIKNFNETIKQLTIDEETFNEDINKIDTKLHQLDDKVAVVEAKLMFFEICEKLMESYLFLEDNINDILNSITFARLKIIHSSIISPDHLIAALQEISQNLVKNNLPLPVRYANIAQYLEIIELEAFQTNSDLVFVLKIPLVEQQTYTVFHLYPIPIHDDRTSFHHILSFTHKYIARNDDSLMYIPIKDISACKRLSPRRKLCSELYAYPIDTNAVCEVQLLKNIRSLPENCRSSIIFSEGYNVQRLETNTWLVIVSEPLHITVSCISMETKTLVLNHNSIVKLQPDCSAFIGISKVQAEPLNVINISDNAHPVLIPYNCCETFPEKPMTPKLKPLKLDHINMEELDIANHKLDQYSRDLEELINQPFVSRNLPWFTYATIAAIIAIVAIYTILHVWKRSSRTGTTAEKSPRAGMLKETLARTLPKLRPNLKTETDRDDIEMA